MPEHPLLGDYSNKYTNKEVVLFLRQLAKGPKPHSCRIAFVLRKARTEPLPKTNRIVYRLLEAHLFTNGAASDGMEQAEHVKQRITKNDLIDGSS
eukprot:5792992-Amphidinium_carterae.1